MGGSLGCMRGFKIRTHTTLSAITDALVSIPSQSLCHIRICDFAFRFTLIPREWQDNGKLKKLKDVLQFRTGKQSQIGQIDWL